MELTTVPPMTHVGRPVMDHEHRYSRHQTIGMTPQGVWLMEGIMAMLHAAPRGPSGAPDRTTPVSP